MDARQLNTGAGSGRLDAPPKLRSKQIIGDGGEVPTGRVFHAEGFLAGYVPPEVTNLTLHLPWIGAAELRELGEIRSIRDRPCGAGASRLRSWLDSLGRLVRAIIMAVCCAADGRPAMLLYREALRMIRPMRQAVNLGCIPHQYQLDRAVLPGRRIKQSAIDLPRSQLRVDE